VAITRYRCTACGNLTRFDVTISRTTQAFHHYTVGGELEVEDEQILAESVDEVSCRWCGHGRSVEVVSGKVEPRDDTLPPEGTGSAAAGSPAVAPDGEPGAPSPVR
jgi:DNA-directed RNA polymerase subunit RPC12/RpoP